MFLNQKLFNFLINYRYGEYLELCDQIHKYIKPADKILMLGCGNSKLSMDMYDSGFRYAKKFSISLYPVSWSEVLWVSIKSKKGVLFLDT